MSQEALDERKELLGLIKGQERFINECEKNIGYFERRITKMELSLRDIPQVERELLTIERLQSISENIYIFLLKKRAEANITSSSNV